MKKRLVHFRALVLFCLAGISGILQAQDNSPPELAIRLTGGNTVTLSWSNVAPGYVLQEVGTLSAIDPWRGVLQTPLSQATELAVTQPLTNGVGGARFYRLVAKGAPAGFDYLFSRQNDDGTFGSPSQTPLRDTAGVLETLALFGRTDSTFANALSSLNSLSARNNDDLARKATALAATGQDVSVHSANLLASKNNETLDPLNKSYPGAGWGLATGFDNSTLDTALVLRAFRASGKAAGLVVVREGLSASATSPSHPFDRPPGSLGLVLSVRKLTGTIRFRITYPDTSSSFIDVSSGQAPADFNFPPDSGRLIFTAENRTASPVSYTAEVGFVTPEGWNTFQMTTPLAYLGLAQNPDGGWGIQPGYESHFMVTAEVLRSLGAWKPVFAGQQVFQSGIGWLRARQNADGGFSTTPAASNVLETSLAAMAILAADPAASLATTASFLRNSQLPDGSWASNPYQTALAIRALRMPPSVGPLPDQMVVSPTSFTPIPLDSFVADPDNADSQITWRVTGNSELAASISNRVAFITYTPRTNTNIITEQLTFTATDPGGASGSATATFSISPNHPPVVGPIPGQSVGAPGAFTPIYLDN